MQTATQTAKFRKVYADAVIPFDLPEAEWKAAMIAAQAVRELEWKGERIPLVEAVELYALIPGYNEFGPETLAKLQAEFPDAGIEATPARESSVVVYLHIPGKELGDEVCQFVTDNLEADEIDWEGNADGNGGETLRIWWD